MALRPLVGVWFQVHYPPLVGVLPIVRSRYWCAIGRQGVLSLAGWAPQIRTRFHVSRLTQVPVRSLPLSPTGLSPAMVELSRTVRLGSEIHITGPTTPPGRVQVVWAAPRSLAATDGIAFAFSSSGY